MKGFRISLGPTSAANLLDERKIKKNLKEIKPHAPFQRTAPTTPPILISLKSIMSRCLAHPADPKTRRKCPDTLHF